MRLLKKYSLIKVGDYYAIKKHGLFCDSLVNLDIPHKTESLSGSPYFNQALGNKEKASKILKRLKGLDGYLK